MSTLSWISVLLAVAAVVSGSQPGYDGPDRYQNKYKVKCKKPYFPNGDVEPEKYGYHHYDTVYVVCRYGYYETVQTSICGGDGNWHPPLGPTTCKRAICYPPKVHYGVVKPYKKLYYAGSEIRYTCDSNYYHKYKSSVCGHDGRWHPRPHPCYQRGEQYNDADYCYAPKNDDYFHEPYGKKEYRFNEKIEYKCRDGYYAPDGYASYGTCGRGGRFDNNPYKCHKYCQAPEHSKFYYKPSKKRYYKENEYYEFQCQDGYYPPNQRSYRKLTCQKGARFDHEPYACERYCDVPDHSKFHFKPHSKKYLKYDEYYDFECDDGYYLPGNRGYKRLTCGHGGRYDNNPYACEKYCNVLDHSKFHYKPHSKKYLKYDDYYDFECDDGYYLPGGHEYRRLTCGHGGRYDHEPYACEKYCAISSYARYNHAPSTKRLYKHGEYYDISCRVGYYVGSWHDYKRLTCGKHGVFDYSPYACTPYCQAPNFRTYHFMSVKKLHYKAGEKYTITCSSGYRRSRRMSHDYVTCGRNGKFDSGFYACEKYVQFCDAPHYNTFHHRPYLTTKYRVGQKIRYNCADGYDYPTGHSYRYGTCLAGGKFDRNPYACEKRPVYCRPPDYRRYHHLSYTKTQYSVGDRINYKCSSGYLRSKSQSYLYATCLSTGKFNRMPYACIKRPVYCPAPAYSRYYHKSYSKSQYKVGERIDFFCAEGYYRPKSYSYSYGTCLGSGRFDHGPYTCEKRIVYCHPPPHSGYNHKRYAKSQYSVGEKLYYYCADGYLRPKSHSYTYGTCLDSGKFDHAPYACEKRAVYCRPPDHSRFHHRSYSRTQYSVGQRIDYKCDEGYYPPKSHSYGYGTCLGTGKFDWQPYACERRVVYCSAPKYTNFYHKSYSKNQYSVGERINYNCADGYYRPSSLSYSYGTCLDSGKFDHGPYSCEKSHSYCDAPKYGNFHHRDYGKKHFNVGDKINFHCSDGYYRPKQYTYNSAYCLDGGKFDQVPYACEKHQDDYHRDDYHDDHRDDFHHYCNAPSYDEFHHRDYGKRRYNVGDKINYHCADGYHRPANIGYDHAFCLDGGKFDNAPWACQRAFSPTRPPLVRHCRAPNYKSYHHRSYSKSHYDYGERITYHCENGYYRPSQYSYTYATCQVGGGFDRDPYTCERDGLYCDVPDYSRFHHQSYGKRRHSIGEKIHYTCAEGYRRPERYSYGYGTCLGGRYDNDPYECEKHESYTVYCKSPNAYDYHHKSYSKTQYSVGDRISYDCEDGYHRPDSYPYGHATCLGSGKFDKKPYYCQKHRDVYRDDPYDEHNDYQDDHHRYCNAPSYGTFHHRDYGKKRYNVGDKINYHCEDGYYRPDKYDYDHAFCLDAGKFDKTPYECQRYCDMPDYTKFHFKPHSKKYLRYEEFYDFECDDGYYLPGNRDYKRLTCGHGGRYDNEPYACERRGQGYSDGTRSGYQNEQYYYEDNRNDGYHDRPHQSSSGSYDEVYCDAPDAYHYHHKAYGKKKYKVHETIYYYCEDGYSRPGSFDYEFATCRKNSQFDKAPYTCLKGGYGGENSYGDRSSYGSRSGYGSQSGYAAQNSYGGRSGYGSQNSRGSYGSNSGYGGYPGQGSYGGQDHHQPDTYGEQQGYGGYGNGPSYGGYHEEGYSGYCEAPDNHHYHHVEYGKKKYKYGEQIYYRCAQGYRRPSTYSYSSAKCKQNNQFEHAPYVCEKSTSRYAPGYGGHESRGNRDWM